MSGWPVVERVEEALGRLDSALHELAGLALYPLSKDELLTLVRHFETIRRRMPTIDHAIVFELEARSVADALGARNTQAVLRDMLRLSPSEANGRVQAARRLGQRESITGEVLEPADVQVAAAQAAGEVSPEQARVITATIEELPASVRMEHGGSVEATLVDAASRFDPITLGKLGRHVHAVLDPDGMLSSDEDQQRRRAATLTQNRDGSGDLRAHLTPESLAKVQATLLPLAAPRLCGMSRISAPPRNASTTRSTLPPACCSGQVSFRRRVGHPRRCCSP
jgi:Domain of unknown function (DUF222)